MSCCAKRADRIEKKYKNNKVSPYDKKMTTEDVDRFSREVIYCRGCNNNFNLGSNELKIHCNICNQFYHCKIAGKCVGKECQSYDHVPSYCVYCVSKIYKDNKCLCKECDLN